MVEVNFSEIESKWQKRWEEEKVFVADDSSDKPNYYVLEMFPYPSGTGLHIGHAWNFLIGDIVARFRRMKGFNVLHPMGFDALGLPAENAAIKDGTLPREYTDRSIKNFIRQQKKLGFSYDWSRQINSSSPDYYKWDQWIFLKMLEKGLAYQKESNVNWCPSCKTVLANEQAQTGNCDRCGTKVEIKYLKQWFLRITDYADELYEGIDNLKDWPDKTKAMQKHWIGKSYGTEIDFQVGDFKWPIFTTRPDTLFGVTFMVVSAKHKKLWDLVTNEKKQEVKDFLDKLKTVSEKDLADMEKEGVFTGSYAKNPINGKNVPIYAGNFVVADYGSGMVMAVPAHDKRDFDFAKKYGLEIVEVVKGGDLSKGAYVGEGVLVNSSEFDGLSNVEAKEKITSYLKEKGFGRKVVNFRLRDWGISRQRYWGTPIPIIHCPSCGSVPVPEKDLPVVLPEKVTFGEGNPLETNEEWLNVVCPKCGGKARREADTMDTFVNSSWYFSRYCDPKNSKEIFDKEKVKLWCPVDVYIGGSEHACMHLIYSRFYTKFLRDIGLFEFDEPAKRLFHQGFISGEDGEKMSKSRGNTVDPLDTISKYGVDATRFFLVSVASPDKDFNWSEKGIIGSQRFLRKVMEFRFRESEDSSDLRIKLNKSIKNIGGYYSNFNYRKATIELRELFDLIEKGSSKESYEKFLKLLNPICPHISEELWEKLGNRDFISLSSWPEFEEFDSRKSEDGFNLDEKIISNVLPILEKMEEKGKSFSKVYLYVLPKEYENLNLDFLKEKLKKEIIIFSTADKNKFDPQNKSKKSRPGMPGVYLE